MRGTGPPKKWPSDNRPDSQEVASRAGTAKAPHRAWTARDRPNCTEKRLTIASAWRPALESRGHLVHRVTACRKPRCAKRHVPLLAARQAVLWRHPGTASSEAVAHGHPAPGPVCRCLLQGKQWSGVIRALLLAKQWHTAILLPAQCAIACCAKAKRLTCAYAGPGNSGSVQGCQEACPSGSSCRWTG